MAQATNGWGPAMPTPQRQRRVVLGPVIGLVALAICALLVVGLVGSSIGGAAVVVGTLCALLPVGPVVATFLWIDRWEPEPPRLLLFAFLWGAGFAALSALVINTGASYIIDQASGRGDLYGAVVVAPIVEEALKGAFVLGILIFRYREFDGIVDGIVYAGLVAAGFAFTENILYIGRAFAEDSMAGQTGAVVITLILRGVLSPFAHPLFTAMLGIGAGIAARTGNAAVRIVAVLVGYLLAVGLHALWNGSAVFGGSGFFVVYAVVMVPLFVAVAGVVVWQRRREQRTVVEQLPGFAAEGWIVPSEIPLLSSLAGRRGWQVAVRRRSGSAAAKAVVAYQAAVTELAFLRARIARGSVGPDARQWHDQAISTLIRARADAVGHPEALTVAIRHHAPQGWAPPPAGPPPAGPLLTGQSWGGYPGGYPAGPPRGPYPPTPPYPPHAGPPPRR